MKATAHLTGKSLTNTVEMGKHQLTVDEPVDRGGTDEGPCPQELLAASLASCTAITIAMYARRKGWDLGAFDVSVDYTPAERGCPTRFRLELQLPAGCTDEQRERLQVIAAKCPVHRTLEGDVMFEDRVTVAPAATAGAPAPRSEERSRLSLIRN